MIGKGATSEVIEYGVNKVCKLFYKNCPKECVEMEYQNTKKIYKINAVNVPKPFEIIYIKNRYGIIYERIHGKPLYDFLNGEQKRKALDILVNLHHKLLNCHSKNILSYKEFLIITIKNNKLKADYQLINQINDLPDDDYMCHGDFHPNNILISSNGTPFIIDFVSLCYGPFLYDIARTFFLLNRDDKTLANEYLNKMNVSNNDISKYINVTEKCRKYENNILLKNNRQ